MGNPPIISREKIVSAAIDIINRDGLDRLTLREVAREVGVKAPSLYNHFANKAALQEDIVLAILRKVEVPGDMNKGDWEARVVELCLKFRRTMLAHYKAAPLILHYLPRSVLLETYELWLEQSPHPASVHSMLMEGLEKLTFGSVLFAATVRMDAEQLGESGIIRSIDTIRFPLYSGVIDRRMADEEQLFTQTIRAFLAGVRLRSADDGAGNGF